MLRYFWIKMAKIVSESAFSVKKSLKYCRFSKLNRNFAASIRNHT